MMKIQEKNAQWLPAADEGGSFKNPWGTSVCGDPVCGPRDSLGVPVIDLLEEQCWSKSSLFRILHHLSKKSLPFPTPAASRKRHVRGSFQTPGALF